MSSIGGPGGIGGPKGPQGTGRADGPSETADADEVGDAHEVSGLAGGAAVGPAQLDALAQAIATGRLTPREAIDQLVAQAGADLPAAERADLHELLTDLVAHDPYLSGLANRL